jgi:hypothetical protein
MKATDIINFINEDKFSKYTASQIYDELGYDDFVEYLESLCYRAVKAENIEGLLEMKPNNTMKFNDSMFFSFIQEHRNYNDLLFVNYTFRGGLDIHTNIYSRKYFQNGIPSEDSGEWNIRRDDTDLFNKFRRAIRGAFFERGMVELRKKIDKELK